MRRLFPFFVLLGLAVASGAVAQDGTRPERLYLNNSLLLGSGRVVSLGGAYVGIAEGASGLPVNLASIAQRNPTLDRDWDLDVAASVQTTPRKTFDLDNDGQPDNQYLTHQQLLLGLSLQYKHYALGAYTRATFLSYCTTATEPCQDPLSVTVANSALALAVGFGDDEFLAAVGLYVATAGFSHPPDTWSYAHTGVAFDALYRPRNRPYRIGFSVKPGGVAPLQATEGVVPTVAGRAIFSAAESPATLSLGASWLIGPGAERYNRLSPAARRQGLEEAEGRRLLAAPPQEAPPAGTLLLTLQMDLVSPVSQAAPLGALFTESPALAIGSATSLVPRAGVEYEPWQGRLRTRLGSYLEPSPFPGHPYRTHITFGFELLVLRYIQEWEIAGTLDLAPLYSNFGISVGFWH